MISPAHLLFYCNANEILYFVAFVSLSIAEEHLECINATICIGKMFDYTVNGTMCINVWKLYVSCVRCNLLEKHSTIKWMRLHHRKYWNTNETSITLTHDSHLTYDTSQPNKIPDCGQMRRVCTVYDLQHFRIISTYSSANKSDEKCLCFFISHFIQFRNAFSHFRAQCDGCCEPWLNRDCSSELSHLPLSSECSCDRMLLRLVNCADGPQMKGRRTKR